MLDGAPVAGANVTLCVTPLVLFQVTVPFRVIVTLVGENEAAPMVTDADPLGGGGGGGGGEVISSPPPPPPQASSPPKIKALTHRERTSDMVGSSVAMGVQPGYRPGLHRSCRALWALDERDLGRFGCCAGTRGAAMLPT